MDNNSFDFKEADKYITNISDCFKDIEKSGANIALLLRLQNILTKGCYRSESGNYYRITGHPMIPLLQEENRTVYENPFLNSIQKQYAENNTFPVFELKQCFESSPDTGYEEAIPAKTVSNRPVNALALADRIAMCKKKYMRAAYFGTLREPEKLETYFPGLELICFSHEKDYVFSQNSKSFRKKVDLNYIPDILDVLSYFDIVFFLGCGIFYKPFQEKKDLYEKGALQHVPYNTENTKNCKTIQEKISLYKSIYHEAGIFLSGCGKENTAEKMFDKELFNIICQCAKESTAEVYLYDTARKTVDKGKTDCAVSIEENCGYTTFVYDMKEFGKEKNLVEFDNFIKQGEYLSAINLYQLFENISGNFVSKIIDDSVLWKKEKDYLKKVKALKNSFVLIKQDNGLKLCLSADDNMDKKAMTDFIEKFVEAITDNSMPSLKLRNIFTTLMTENSLSLDGVFYSYLFRMKKIQITEHVQEVIYSQTPFDKKHSQITTTSESIVRMTDNIMVRDSSRIKDTLVFDFRCKYCPGLKKEQLFEAILRLETLCRDIYKDSTMWNVGNLLKEKLETF